MSALPGLRDGRLADRRLIETGRLARALAALNGDGEETRLVGGAVRDLALGAAVGDFDLATTALPEVVMKRARAAGFGVAPTGLAHGTVTVIVEGRPIEATTLRRDIDTTAATPRSPSAATSATTRGGATSPSTRCR